MFLAVLWRDLFVTGRELPVFLAQVVLQPLFMLFVFGKVLSSLGYTRPGYTHLLFPGIVALTALLTALQSTALPLVIEFSLHEGDRGPPARADPGRAGRGREDGLRGHAGAGRGPVHVPDRRS